MSLLRCKNPGTSAILIYTSCSEKMNPFKDGMVGGVYVIHVPKFTERAAHIRSELGKFEIPIEFVLPFDAEDINQETRNRFIPAGGKLTAGQLSCILKHMEAFRRMLAAGQPLALILEDDVVLDGRFNEEMPAILAEAKNLSGPFTIQLGSGSNMFVPGHRLRTGQRLYEAHEVKATDSYLINAAAAKLRLDWLEARTFDRPCGHLFNKVDKEKNIKIYWSEPTIVEQGSMNGFFATSLDGGRKRRTLEEQQHRYRWQRWRKKYLYRLFRWKL